MVRLGVNVHSKGKAYFSKYKSGDWSENKQISHYQKTHVSTDQKSFEFITGLEANLNGKIGATNGDIAIEQEDYDQKRRDTFQEDWKPTVEQIPLQRPKKKE